MKRNNRFFKSALPKFTPLGALIIAISLPFIFAWLRGRLLFYFDTTFITAPEEDIFAHYQRAFKLPLWTPEVQMGYPFIAISHQGFFYPLHMVLRHFLPGIFVVNISLYLHSLLAAVSTYFYLKEEGFKRSPSAFGALFFSGTGFFVGRLFLSNFLLPLTWLPAALWFTSKWYNQKSLVGLVGLALAMSMQILLGQPQAAVITTGVLIIYVISRLFTDFNKTLILSLRLIPAAIIAFLLSYAQIQPTLALIPHTDRAEALPKNELYEFAYPLSHAVTWIFPGAFGLRDSYFGGKNEVELSSWAGIIMLLMAGAGVVKFRNLEKRIKIFVLSLALISLLIISGKNSPVYSFLVENNILTSLSVPSRWLALLFLSGSILTAQGVKYLLDCDKRKKLRLLSYSLVVISIPLFFSFISLDKVTTNRIIDILKENYLSTSIPIIALFFLFPIVWLIPRRITPLFFLLAVLELSIPNISRTISEPAKNIMQKPILQNALDEQLKYKTNLFAGRIFTTENLASLPPPRVNFEPLKPLNKDNYFRQKFISLSSQIDGLNLEMRWNDRAKQKGELALSIIDLTTEERRSLVIPFTEIHDGTWVPIKFSPFYDVLNHEFEIEISSKTAGLHALYYSFAEDYKYDILYGGSAEICVRKTGCGKAKVGSNNPREVDLTIEPVYPVANKYLLVNHALDPHAGSANGYAGTQWAGALQLEEVKKYLFDVGDQNENYPGYNSLLLSRREMFNRLGISYLLGRYDFDPSSQTFPDTLDIAQNRVNAKWFKLFKNTSARPRIEFVTNIKAVPDSEAARKILRSVKKPDDPTPVEGIFDTDKLTLGKGTIELKVDDNDKIIIKTTNKDSGFLVLRDTYFPNWSAKINGRESKIYKTDMIFRGLLLPPGENITTFEYKPAKTLQAIKISLTAWGVLFAFLMILAVRKVLKYFENRKFIIQ